MTDIEIREARRVATVWCSTPLSQAVLKLCEELEKCHAEVAFLEEQREELLDQIEQQHQHIGLLDRTIAKLI